MYSSRATVSGPETVSSLETILLDAYNPTSPVRILAGNRFLSFGWMSNKQGDEIMKIEETVKQVTRIVTVFVCIVALTRRPLLSSATMPPTATVRQARQLPLKSLRGSLWWFRKLCFTRSRPSEPSIIVPQSKEVITGLLSRNDFVPGWTVSYNYRDEILNFRRIERLGDPSGFEWWQVHIRGYAHPEGIELTAHFEPEPRRHPRAHITLSSLDIGHGMKTLLELLDCHEVGYDWVDSPVKPYAHSSSRSV